MQTRPAIVFALGLALAAVPAFAAEASFDRNLTVNGRVDLTVSTGAGHIHLTTGPAGQVHISGHVRSNWGASDDQVRNITDHPPIQQTGNIIRIGHQMNLHNISIDYDIQAPADSYLEAGTGSGEIEVDGVGTNARLHTGSGRIHAVGLHGGFSAGTGSGSIYAEQTGDGDVKAETGSGSIELRSIRGGLIAHTGSGSIKAEGTPTGQWKLHTGSGSVEVWTGTAGITLDASTGSGGIHTDREISTEGNIGRHHVTGRIGGGGPTVQIGTGSGGIHVH